MTQKHIHDKTNLVIQYINENKSTSVKKAKVSWIQANVQQYNADLNSSILTTNLLDNPSKNMVLIGVEDVVYTVAEEHSPKTIYREKKARPQTASCINILGVQKLISPSEAESLPQFVRNGSRSFLPKPVRPKSTKQRLYENIIETNVTSYEKHEKEIKIKKQIIVNSLKVRNSNHLEKNVRRQLYSH